MMMRVRVRFCVKVCVLMQRVLLVSTKYSTKLCVFSNKCNEKTETNNNNGRHENENE